MFPVLRLGIPPCWRTYFLLLRQKKVAKEKATPGYAVGYADFPALFETGGCCGTRATPSDSPRPFSAAFSVTRRFTRGPKSGMVEPECRKTVCCGQPEKKSKNKFNRLATDALPGPLRGAEQRRSAGGSRRALFEGRSPELRSRPAFRVAQGIRRSRTPTQGSPFLCLLSFGEAKESETPARRNPMPKKAA